MADMLITETTREKALKYLYKRIRKARLSLGRVECKSGAEREKAGLNEKLEVLEWLTEIVLKEDGRQ